MVDNKLSVHEFGRKLIDSGDLDPVYTVVYLADMDRDLLQRWLLAYWCFYHVGTASLIAYGASSEEEFWHRMATAAASSTNPRGRERRHFRAKNAINSVTYLSSQGIGRLLAPFQGKMSVAEVTSEVQRWVGFGPWIAFKVADMLDSLGICKVKFDIKNLVLFDSPLEACEILWESHFKIPIGDRTAAQVCDWGIAYILSELGRMKAPPAYDRLVNIQEAETVLCKWKAYYYGRYHIGEDIQAVRKHIMTYPKVRLNQELFKAGRKGKLWP